MANMKNVFKKLCDSLKEEKQVAKEYTFKVGDEETTLTYTVNTTIKFEDMVGLVNSIADAVIARDKREIWNYIGGTADIIKKATILAKQTNIPWTNLEDMYAICTYTTIYDDVVQVIGIDKVEKIFSQADEVIEARLHYLEGQTTINELIGKATEVFDELKGKIGGINPEIIQRVLENVSADGSSSLGELANLFKFMPQQQKEIK